MDELVFIENNQVVTDSFTISRVFNKRHDHVLEDIRNQMNKLVEAGRGDFNLPNFREVEYRDSKGRIYTKFVLTEDAFTLVTFGYTTVDAMRFKVDYIQEFKRMKHQLELMNTPSYAISDPIARAHRWIDEEKERQDLQRELA